jgi:hypothetical protein
MLWKCSKFGKRINSKITLTKKWIKSGDSLITVQFRVFYFSAPIWQRNDCIIKTFSFTCCLVYVSIIVFTCCLVYVSIIVFTCCLVYVSIIVFTCCLVYVSIIVFTCCLVYVSVIVFTCCLVYVSIIVFTAVRTPDLVDLGCLRTVVGQNLCT